MKTQINTLQKGNHIKGIAGTNHEIRYEVAQKVKNENPTSMTIRFCGHEITLDYKESSSGKSFWYESKPLHTDLVKKIWSIDNKAINEPNNVIYTFVINDLMFCEIQTMRRRHEGAIWKQGQTIHVEESEVVIC